MTVPPTVFCLMVLLGIALQPAVPSSPTPQAGPTQFVRVYAADTPRLVVPKAIQTPNPLYTPEAFHARVQGRIALEVTVGQDGHVRDALVTQGLDSATGIDQRALDAISGWLFEPGTREGQPVAVRTTVTFDFKLR